MASTEQRRRRREDRRPGWGASQSPPLVCVVFDEAHKMTGSPKPSWCRKLRFLQEENLLAASTW